MQKDYGNSVGAISCCPIYFFLLCSLYLWYLYSQFLGPLKSLPYIKSISCLCLAFLISKITDTSCNSFLKTCYLKYTWSWIGQQIGRTSQQCRKGVLKILAPNFRSGQRQVWKCVLTWKKHGLWGEAGKPKTCLDISEMCCEAEVICTPFDHITKTGPNKWFYLLLFGCIILYIPEQIRVARMQK